MNKFWHLKVHSIAPGPGAGQAGPGAPGRSTGVGGSSGTGGLGGGSAGPSGSRAGGRGGRDGGGGVSRSGTLSADLGGGLSANIDARTGDVTSFSGPGVPGGVRGAQFRAGVADVRSAFGNFLSNLTPEQIGAAGGALAGTLLGVGPAAGAVAGAKFGGLFGEGAQEIGNIQPGGFSGEQAPGQTAQATPTQAAPSLAGVSPAGQGLAGGQLGGEGSGGVISQPAQQLAATGRQSGLAPAQTPFQQPQSQFLNRLGPLPTVNLQAFPSALGRV
jgi:hypothetical protein